MSNVSFCLSLSLSVRCTSEDLKYIIRLIKHDLRIFAGAKHMSVKHSHVFNSHVLIHVQCVYIALQIATYTYNYREIMQL